MTEPVIREIDKKRYFGHFKSEYLSRYVAIGEVSYLDTAELDILLAELQSMLTTLFYKRGVAEQQGDVPNPRLVNKARRDRSFYHRVKAELKKRRRAEDLENKRISLKKSIIKHTKSQQHLEAAREQLIQKTFLELLCEKYGVSEIGELKTQAQRLVDLEM